MKVRENKYKRLKNNERRRRELVAILTPSSYKSIKMKTIFKYILRLEFSV